VAVDGLTEGHDKHAGALVAGSGSARSEPGDGQAGPDGAGSTEFGAVGPVEQRSTARPRAPPYVAAAVRWLGSTLRAFRQEWISSLPGSVVGVVLIASLAVAAVVMWQGAEVGGLAAGVAGWWSGRRAPSEPSDAERQVIPADVDELAEPGQATARAASGVVAVDALSSEDLQMLEGVVTDRAASCSRWTRW
jgi:hypothetical protein